MEQAPERGRSYARFGAFLDADVAGFDASAFRLARPEAVPLDPHARLLLEQTLVGFCRFLRLFILQHLRQLRRKQDGCFRLSAGAARGGAAEPVRTPAAGLDAGRPPLGNAIIKTAVLQFGL